MLTSGTSSPRFIRDLLEIGARLDAPDDIVAALKPEVVRDAIEYSALTGVNEDSELRDLIAAGERLGGACDTWFRAEAAIYHLLCGRVRAAAEFIGVIVGQPEGCNPERYHLAIGWYCGATGQYSAARQHLEKAIRLDSAGLEAAVLYRVLLESGTQVAERCTELDGLLQRSLSHTGAFGTFEYLDARAFALRTSGELRGSLAVRIGLWRKFRDGPPLLSAVVKGRLAMLLGELGQLDWALGVADPAGSEVIHHPPGAALEYLRTVRQHLRFLAKKLVLYSPESASRMARVRRPIPEEDLPVGVNVRVTSSYAAWNLECSIWLGDLAANRDTRLKEALDDYRHRFEDAESPMAALRVRSLCAFADRNSAALSEVCRELRATGSPLDEMDALRKLGHLDQDACEPFRNRYAVLKREIGATLRRPMHRWFWETGLAPDNDPWHGMELASLPGSGNVAPAPMPAGQSRVAVVRFLSRHVWVEQELLYHLAKSKPGEKRSALSLEPGPCGRALFLFSGSEQYVRSFVLYRDSANRLHCIDSGIRKGRGELRPLVQLVAQRSDRVIRTQIPSWVRDRREALAAISALLAVGTMATLLPPYVSRLSIHPDSLLAGLPFATLPDSDGQPLVRRFAVSIQPFLARQERVEAATPVVLAAKVPNPSRGYPRLEQLGKIECSDLASTTVPGCSVVSPTTDDTLGPGFLQTNLAAATHFLFLGHGDFDESGRRGLVLPSRQDAQYFSGFHLADIRTPRLQLAALFCCHVGDSQPTPLYWSFGLTTVFLRAGTANVLASLWPANEGFVCELIPVFCSYLRTMEPELALQASQLEMLRRGRDAANWAGFVLFRRGATKTRLSGT